ncbi:hypothetical protein QFW77_02610 [Luteimonas sp. RD2P54]|uniref:Uncharacterized protein n=1 Tax=Luteimonas endophytica TaxID=3042023 RepID=A0ABT6J5S4_9GAMM|nr:hypothetical protein [Luteimonas endophytica]MDH5821887.1 hypothetical protein [Luteimonas endophytica]
MTDSQPCDTWIEYAKRKRAERLCEAEQVWSALVAGGGGDETVLAVDFTHFGPSQGDVESLGRQLSEHYTVKAERGPDAYWRLEGTTRPYGITLSAADHISWVGFMCDVAQSHGCVFSTWSLSAPALALTVRSEPFERDS